MSFCGIITVAHLCRIVHVKNGINRQDIGRTSMTDLAIASDGSAFFETALNVKCCYLSEQYYGNAREAFWDDFSNVVM